MHTPLKQTSTIPQTGWVTIALPRSKGFHFGGEGCEPRNADPIVSDVSMCVCVCLEIYIICTYSIIDRI